MAHKMISNVNTTVLRDCNLFLLYHLSPLLGVLKAYITEGHAGRAASLASHGWHGNGWARHSGILSLPL